VPRPRARPILSLLVGALAAAVLWSGRVGATVEEQRQRLPPPAACADPIEGVWMGHKYDDRDGEWYVYTLTVKRNPPLAASEAPAPGGSTLTGTIDSHFWSGGPKDVQPPPCKPGGFRWLVHMPATGTSKDLQIQFGGTSWRGDPPLCPEPHALGYNPDNFTGTVDPKIQEFQSVNNDGGKAVNSPTVFRRIRCFDPPPPVGVTATPGATATPPAFEPPRRALGCGRSQA
jgi:hypothetical protein